MYSGLNSDSLFLSDLKSLDEHSFDDSTRRMLHVRLKESIAYQIGSPAKIQSALEHIADIVEDLVVEANLPLIVLVFDASRAQQNVVVVVGAVQAQLLVRFMNERKKEHDSNRAPYSQNDPHQCHFYE